MVTIRTPRKKKQRAPKLSPPPITPGTPSPTGVLAISVDPKTDLVNLRDEAARALGLTQSSGYPDPTAPEANATPFAMMIESLSETDPYSKAPKFNGKLRFMSIVREMARSSPSSKHVRMIEAWDHLTPRQQSGLDLLDLCNYAALDPHTLAGQVFAYLSRLGADIGGMLASLAYPDIVKTTLESARELSGIEDRKMVHQHFGFLPQPRGATVVNGPQINQGAGSLLVAGQISGTSDFEKLMMDEDSEEGRGVRVVDSSVIPSDDDDSDDDPSDQPSSESSGKPPDKSIPEPSHE